MAHFKDIPLLLFLTQKQFKNRDFGEYAEQELEYQSSLEWKTQAIEKSHFIWKGRNILHDSSLDGVIQLEQDLLPILAKMEDTGVYVDRSLLQSLTEELYRKAKDLEVEMHDLVGEPFNPLSAKQVQYILYEKLGISPGKKIKTGFSVDSDTLEEIGKTYEIANMILAYRGYEKLRSTYTEWLQKEIASDGRIHTNYRQTVASTGRLSSESPNLQNIPTGAGYGQLIKSAFRPESLDEVFVVADYSQVELRVLAMMSGDSELQNAFRNGEDIHARTAKFLFPGSQISSDQRRIAKSVNFGVIYGITGFGLSQMIGASPREATAYIEQFYALYPGVRTYYDGLLEKARVTGYVETAFGRRRYIKGLTDANSMIRSGAEREAINMPIQWTAADVIKYAMLELDRWLESTKGRLLMQVHDELVFEVAKENASALESLIREVMEWVYAKDGITLRVDIHSGDNWASTKG